MASSTAQHGLNPIQTAGMLDICCLELITWLMRTGVEELVERYQKSSAGRAFGKLERAWLAAIFKKFATGSDGQEGKSMSTRLDSKPRDQYLKDIILALSSSDLADVLALFFPENCASIVQEAAPILHRSLLSLGSFPYLNNPAPYLTLETFQAALLILTNRDDSKLRRNMDNEDDDVYQKKLDARKFRMIFQSITNLARDTSSGNESTSRNAEDDEDLREVYEYVVSHNYQDQDLGHTVVHVQGPELAALESFPSSQSRKLDGAISYQDLKSLVKILLVTQLFDTVDPEKAAENSDQLDHVVESVTRAFGKEGSNVSWTTYERAVSQSVVSFLSNHYKIG